MSMETQEARIQINGQELASQESLTVRVAVSDMLYRMRCEGLGSDSIGKQMAADHLQACESILKKLAPS